MHLAKSRKTASSLPARNAEYWETLSSLFYRFLSVFSNFPWSTSSDE
uniref:Uncharacterized protein n=1 Tax=Anguilla anguilla TaxID=7936 RepID=A0A0E9WES7_ANGAN